MDIDSNENLKSYTDNLKFLISDRFQSNTLPYIKPEELRFGGKKKGYFIDIQKILQLFSTNYEVNEIFLKDNNLIKLALYHDEVVLVNPLGNIYRLLQFKVFLFNPVDENIMVANILIDVLLRYF